jgi:hypothetical protein
MDIETSDTEKLATAAAVISVCLSYFMRDGNARMYKICKDGLEDLLEVKQKEIK